MVKCDIIVPIYNAYDCLEPCIESIIQNTDLKENRIILIDDKSTDKRVLPLLKKYSINIDGIILLENNKNLGFVGTVNRGMKYSNNDVLLLNSDTEVTNNWLVKIKKCAYSKKNVATVTPLSNNATLVSVPEIFERNDIPTGFSLSQMAKIVEECSYTDYPELPTAHGFCMYIKREVLKKVGFFDEHAFGKGYGEENDFCFRCFDHGYRHLLCDNTYIYHKESQSFNDSKIELMKNGSKKLLDRYPTYQKNLDSWCEQKPIQYIGNNISFSVGVNNKKKNILYIIHDWKNVKNHLGGTTLHAYDLIKNMQSKYNFHVLAPEDGVFKLYSYWGDNESILKFNGVRNFNKFEYYNEDYKIMVQKIITNYNISTIHIHHMKGHYFDLIDLISQNDLYSIISLHDYYSVCPIINKLYKNEIYCNNPSVSKCNECLRCVKNIYSSMITEWRDEWKILLENVDKIIVPSDASKKEISKTYQNIKPIVIEHGVDIEKKISELNVNDDKIFNIAFVGAIGIHKGRNILENMLKSKKIGKIKIHLFGTVDNFKQKNNRHYINHGTYDRKDLKNLLCDNNIKLICLFSICPETYSYTLTECVASGVPVLGIDIGAVGDRIKRNKFGWTIKQQRNTDIYIDKINEIFNNKKEYEKIINNLNKYKIKSVKKMSNEYKKIYSNDVLKDNKQIKVKEIRNLIKSSQQYIANVNYSNYEWVFDTVKWKIISKIKIPRKIKKMFKKED